MGVESYNKHSPTYFRARRRTGVLFVFFGWFHDGGGWLVGWLVGWLMMMMMMMDDG